MRSNTRTVPTRLFLLTCLTVGGMGLSSCATAPKPLQIAVPESLKAECQIPPGEGVRTVGDLAAHDIATASELRQCEGRRSALVEIIEGANDALKPKRKWWRF